MAKKHTIEEIAKEFDKRNYTLLSKEYINTRNKLEFICNKHYDMGIQYISYDKFHYANHGCKYCGKEKNILPQRITEKKVKEIAQKKEVKFVSIQFNYQNTQKTFIEFVCPVHAYKGHQYMEWSTFKRGILGCPYCKNKIEDKTDFNLKLVSKNIPYELISDYTNSKDYLIFKCLIHNTTFEATPSSILCKKSICPECKKLLQYKTHRRITKEEFQSKLNDMYPQLQVIGEINNSTDKVKMYCKEHNTFFEESPNTYLYKHRIGCCPNYSYKKTNEQFLDDLHKAVNFIIPLEDYKGSFTKISFKCLKHNFIWEATPNNVITTKHCPKCCNILKGESIISHLLTEWNYNFTPQKRFEDCRNKRPLPFDFYLDDFNICIEYDGEFHYYPIPIGKMTYEEASLRYKQRIFNDNIKNQYCAKNNIGLIRIPYWEKDNLEYFLFNALKEHNVII